MSLFHTTHLLLSLSSLRYREVDLPNLHTHHLLWSPGHPRKITSERCLSHLTDRKTECWRAEVTCLRSRTHTFWLALCCFGNGYRCVFRIKGRPGLSLWLPPTLRLTPGPGLRGGFQPLTKHVSPWECTQSLPEKEEPGAGVNQKPYDQTHLSELCEKREGCK